MFFYKVGGGGEEGQTDFLIFIIKNVFVEIEGGVCGYPGEDKRSWSASTQNKIYHCAVLNSTVVLLSSSSALQSLEVVSHVRTEHQRV